MSIYYFLAGEGQVPGPLWDPWAADPALFHPILLGLAQNLTYLLTILKALGIGPTWGLYSSLDQDAALRVGLAHSEETDVPN